MSTSTLRRLRDAGETLTNPEEDVRGRKVLDSTGARIGTVDALLVDDAENRVRFLRVESGGLLGLGTTHTMIPADAISGITHDAVTINHSSTQVQGAPVYDPALIEQQEDLYWGGLFSYYGYAPFWGAGYMYPSYPYRQHKPDAQITQDIQDELAFDPQVMVKNLKVTATDGHVTLAGSTPSYASKWEAAQSASRVGMVHSVSNALAVDPTILGARSDDAIMAAIHQIFALDGIVPEHRVTVQVQEGIVTLTGSLDHFFQRQASEADARKILGVVEITNQISVVPTAPIAGDSQERISQAFRRSTEFAADQITVALKGSVVTLTGSVRTWREREKAEYTAWCAAGVTGVTNNIQVVN